MSESIQLQKTVVDGTESGPHLVITGGVHGDEFEPMAALRKLSAHFDGDARNGLRGRLTVAPVVNEAAYLRGARTAEDELDLARVCPGDPEGSITERTAHALAELIRSADYYMDLHTGGTKASVWPMSGYYLHPDPEILEKQRTMARAFNLPAIWGTRMMGGRSLSVSCEAGIPGIYAEYHGSATCDAEGVDEYVQGCLNLMSHLNMIDRPAPPSRVLHFVEDDRDDAGIMDLHNQSPLTGYFDSAVQLGDYVEKGSPLGTVCDVLGADVREVCSESSGYVLTLRTYPRIIAGDMLAVILEAPPAG
jgi:predicted deacylase